MKDELIDAMEDSQLTFLALRDVLDFDDEYIEATIEEITEFIKNGKDAISFRFVTNIAQQRNCKAPAKLKLTTYKSSVAGFFPFGYKARGNYIVDYPSLSYTDEGDCLIPDDGTFKSWSFPSKNQMLFYDLEAAEVKNN